ncbi:hypothetical protein [Thiohalorhabdus methylotrophus]|uniref:EF-hand domain-containing protein n=1 Tax=Thiohalorhabdus methylotrophus TaxID=3242694 RepID=A0ABV4TVG8_9GAMM
MRMLTWLAATLLLAVATPVLGASDSGKQSGANLPKFQKVDENGDSKLTYQEVKDQGVKKERFKEEDLNNDGKLTKYDYKYGLK